MKITALEPLRLAEPMWLFAIALIPLLIWLKAKYRPSEPKVRFSSLSNFSKQNHFGKAKFLWIIPFLKYFSLVMLTVALSRPQIDKSTESIESSGVDIVLAVYLSASMLALDMSANEKKDFTRLDIVKEVLKTFIEKRRNDRIGIVAFSVNPYLVSALTLDKEHLLKNLTRLRVGLTHQTGTNIGAALAEGINRLRPLESKSKVLILLTDGKDEPPPQHSPMVFAEGAQKDQIKIYTIAIGTNSRTRTYLYDPSVRDLVKYPNGKPIVQVADYPVDKEILRRIAEKTEARFFEAKDKDTLLNIYEEIDRLEKTKVEFKVNALFEELFQWPLSLAIISIFLQFTLSRTIFLKLP